MNYKWMFAFNSILFLVLFIMDIVNGLDWIKSGSAFAGWLAAYITQLELELKLELEKKNNNA